MKRIWLATLAAAALAIAFVASSLISRQVEARSASEPKRRILYYRDPMHPSYTSPEPGRAPDCGMDLEPVYADAAHPAMPDAIEVSPLQEQSLGIRMGKVEMSSTTGTFRTLGRVVLDETRVFPVIASTEGWVTQVYGGTTGSIITKGQPLAAVYGREYTTLQRSLLFALKAVENPPPTIPGDYQDQPAFTLREAQRNLETIGVAKSQIQEIMKTRQVALDITLTAPADGVIVARNVSPMQKFDRGSELFRIADLRRIWVVADLFADEARYIKTGEMASIFLPGRNDVRLAGTVSEALPSFDSGSRTLKVRLEVDNKDLLLRPDMFADLEFSIRMPEAATVPAEAVSESGVQPVVFVQTAPGTFEPRAVRTGWRFANRVQILDGLRPGEPIVISGNFLLDSEKRMRLSDPRRHD